MDYAMLKIVNGNYVKMTEEEIAEHLASLPQKTVEIPSQISAVNMRKALRAAELDGKVSEWLETQSADVRDEWEYSTYFERTHPTFQAGVQALGLDEATLDALFEQYGEFSKPGKR
jgi:hypothetical protein